MEKTIKAQGFENEYLYVIQRDFIEQFHDDMLFSSLLVTDIGYFPHAKYHFRRRNNGCREAILQLCVAGSGHYKVADNDSVSITDGQAFLLPAEVPHQYAADEEMPWSVYWVHFTGCAAPAVCELLSTRQPLVIAHDYIEEATRLFHRCFDLLKGFYQREEYYTVCQYVAAILGVVAISDKQAELPLTEKGDQAVKAAVTFMKKNLHRQLCLNEIAATVNFSASHLNCLFKAVTGNAPMEYFLRMKMQAAGKDLFFTNRSVKEVAANYGILDSCYFSRIFKKVMGIPPLAYRNLIKG